MTPGADFYDLLRPLLFRLDPETAHRWTVRGLRVLGATRPGRMILRSLAGAPAPGTVLDCLGLRFANRLGLAAGYDKDALALRGLASLGFGHIEVGTVVPSPQPGNARPRLFRLEEDRALVNRLGFPSTGAAAVARRLKGGHPPGVVLGINVGKAAVTPLDRAVEDYVTLVDTFRSLADYLTINVSSPNTLGLRRLQGRDHLERLLTGVRRRLEDSPGPRPPLLVKLAPDLDLQELEDALAACTGRVEGIIAVNTTTARPGLQSPHAGEAGGLSGRPLFSIALDQVKRIVSLCGGRLVVVGCGGIAGPDDVRAMVDAGATLVQVYTALIYEGPRLPRRLLAAS